MRLANSCCWARSDSVSPRSPCNSLHQCDQLGAVSQRDDGAVLAAAEADGHAVDHEHVVVGEDEVVRCVSDAVEHVP